MLHWDFLLEAGPVLRAWRLRAEPSPGLAIPADPNFDHRRVYLDYEGPIAGERGCVHRWDAGDFEWLNDEPNHVEVILRGAKLRGRASISSGTFQLQNNAT